jgi:colicin import membrane protein
MFSLQELARMEDDRVKSQAEAAQLERESLEAARRQSEARARAEEEARELAEAEQREGAERKEREEAARVDAINRGAVEAARYEVETRARAEERERERGHELAKLEIARKAAEGERASVLRMLVAGAMGVVLAGVVASGLYLGIVQPGEKARVEQATSDLARRDTLISDAHTATSAAEGQVQTLTGELATAKADIARLQKQIDDLNRRPASRGWTGPRPHQSGASGADVSVGLTSCPPGSSDPLCVQH